MHTAARWNAVWAGVSGGATVALLLSTPWSKLPDAAATSWAVLERSEPILQALVLMYISVQIPLTVWRWASTRMGLDFHGMEWGLTGREALWWIFWFAGWGALVVLTS